jgi:hypothetical protein
MFFKHKKRVKVMDDVILKDSDIETIKILLNHWYDNKDKVEHHDLVLKIRMLNETAKRFLLINESTTKQEIKI